MSHIGTAGRFPALLPEALRQVCAVVLVSAALFGPHGAVAQTPPLTAAVKEADRVLWSKPGPGALAEARQALETAARDGDAGAQRLLGLHLLNGWVLEADAARGLALLEQAAQAGDARAEAELGQAYLWGKRVPQDAARAAALLSSAAGKGDAGAQRVLGVELAGGWTLPRDAERGRHLLEQAIAGGDAEAHVALGKLLMEGTGLPMDKSAALAHFEAAAEAGNGAGLAAYGEYLMWRFTAPAEAEAMLVRAGELGATGAWVTLAHGAMYGYLGGGAVSRAKFDGYAEKARAAGEDEIAVLEATRNMWGINMRADGPQTIARLTDAAERGNAEAARFLIALLRDGNGLNLRRDLKAAAAALERYGPLLSERERAQYAFTLRAKAARTPEAYAPVAEDYAARPDLKSAWFGREIFKANPNVAFYILQRQFRAEGSYAGPLDGYATRATLRAVYRACRALDHPDRCNDTVMRDDIIGDLLAR